MTHILERLPRGSNAYYNDANENLIAGEGVIFVAGTNLQGRHGKGAALTAAKHYGAPEGHCSGPMGQYFGIPTRQIIGPRQLETLPLDLIYQYVLDFVFYTLGAPYTFLVTPIGTGNAGYRDIDIAPMFRDVENCWLPGRWKEYIE